MNKVNKVNKLIIGLLGTPNSGRTTVAKIFKKKGFYLASINDKVEEFAHHLFSDNELRSGQNCIFNKVRQQGYSVSKEYWLNLILVSVPDKINFIIFDDISLEETNNKNTIVYQIYRPGVSTIKMDDIETIENDGYLKSLTKKIEDLHDQLVSSS